MTLTTFSCEATIIFGMIAWISIHYFPGVNTIISDFTVHNFEKVVILEYW